MKYKYLVNYLYYSQSNHYPGRMIVDYYKSITENEDINEIEKDITKSINKENITIKHVHLLSFQLLKTYDNESQNPEINVLGL